MTDIFRLQLLLATFAGWVNRHQAQAIEYLVEENRVLKEQLGNKRLRLTDDQRRRLAAKGHALGRRLLAQVATIVTPEAPVNAVNRAHAASATIARPPSTQPSNAFVSRTSRCGALLSPSR